MSIKKLITFALATSIPLASLLFIVGCESADPDKYTITVTPAYSEVNKINQSVRLSAKGWSDYTWFLSNTDIGTLSSTHGESVTYVVRALPISTTTNSTAAAIEQTITVAARNIVTASSNSSGSNTTTTVSGVYTSTARIMHRPQ